MCSLLFEIMLGLVLYSCLLEWVEFLGVDERWVKIYRKFQFK